MDVHVPAAVTRGLLLRNVDVLTAQLDGTTEMEDPDLLDRARVLNRVLVSQDEDFTGGSRALTAKPHFIQRPVLRTSTGYYHWPVHQRFGGTGVGRGAGRLRWACGIPAALMELTEAV